MSYVFVQVTWDKLGSDNFGNFMCDVVRVDAFYNGVTKSSTEMDSNEFKILIDYFVFLSKKTNTMAVELKETTQTLIPRLKKGLEDLGSSAERRLRTLDDKGTTAAIRLKTLGESTERRLKTLDDQGKSTETRLNIHGRQEIYNFL